MPKKRKPTRNKRELARRAIVVGQAAVDQSVKEAVDSIKGLSHDDVEEMCYRLQGSMQSSDRTVRIYATLANLGLGVALVASAEREGEHG